MNQPLSDDFEFAKMICLSTGHLKQETAEMMTRLANCAFEDLPVYYEKGEYGFFVHVMYYAEPVNEIPAEDKGYPEELQLILRLARQQRCHWVMLDRDGETTDQLPKYEW